MHLHVEDGPVDEEDHLAAGQGEEEVMDMAEFICIYYVVWWLQGYLGVKDPMNDLKAMQQMRVYRKYRQLAADTCIAS